MRPRKEPRSNRSWIFSRWFFVVLGLVLILLVTSLSKEFYRSHQVNKEIDSLKDQVIALETNNAEFSEFVEYLKTDIYFEEQARIKLGMKQPGEKVLVLKEGDEVSSGDDSNKSLVANLLSKKDGQLLSNRQKWWLYFFADTNNTNYE